jgi:uncharacterized membrane protein YhaH (DUF805 family)
MNWFIFALKNFGDFKGRARRSEFWFFQLFFLIAMLILVFIDNAIGTADAEDPSIGILSGIFILVMLIPSISVSVRRLHDTGRSGWYYLLQFVPFISLALLFFWAENGKYGPNQWGLDPKQGSS